MRRGSSAEVLPCGGYSSDYEPSLRRDSAAGHYSVLVDIDSKDVVVHDPLLAQHAACLMPNCWNCGCLRFPIRKLWEGC